MTVSSRKQPTTTDQPTTNTYLLFNVLLPTTSSTILDKLLPTLITASIREDSISHSICFTGFPSIYNMDEKMATLTVIRSLLTDNIKSIISSVIPSTSPSQPAPTHLHTHTQLTKST
jgi:hypothetical protein